MKPLSIMVVAGEPSGDQLAAELVRALRAVATPFAPEFFGAGGERMAAAGVELAVDLTRHAVIGVPTPGQYAKFRQLRDDLVALAVTRTPDIVIGVDFFAFNGSLAERIRAASEEAGGPFQNWRPKLVQYVSPQVWASRAGRAQRLERTHDLLLSILPFEAEWYARHAPKLRVQFVGHPLVERHAREGSVERSVPKPEAGAPPEDSAPPELLLLPGSRAGELRRHLPVMLAAAQRVETETGAALRMVVPSESLLEQARPLLVALPRLRVQVGGLSEALAKATVALASTGTVTLECAWFGVPTVALYKTSPLTYAIGKRIVTVKFLAMPN
ncbi:MAG TPA: lipid-A-disaccharide synthase, partial [Candidatus Limnocylindria bacterium]|nr:lipid-A-disaccharide synthase [Candidatus Limnocylindria bacterium]